MVQDMHSLQLQRLLESANQQQLVLMSQRYS